MRFMMLLKGSADTEGGILPKIEFFKEMDKYNAMLKKVGMLISLDGLKPSSSGARVVFSGDERTVIKGPFAYPEDLVAGYWVIKAKDLDEAVEWAERVPFTEGVIEVREIEEISDFPSEIRNAIKHKKHSYI